MPVLHLDLRPCSVPFVVEMCSLWSTCWSMAPIRSSILTMVRRWKILQMGTLPSLVCYNRVKSFKDRQSKTRNPLTSSVASIKCHRFLQKPINRMPVMDLKPPSSISFWENVKKGSRCQRRYMMCFMGKEQRPSWNRKGRP
ncbi:hypothetical protein NA56DRAFT_492722 [Hyaloscypha hepaticicola]|uniref:Uncharacterized protein n=1 Tax=Hyaloscypha hepaticicola TaxID=2082293 RepID=A0A2J6QEC3_9HELO|nr:hypothetical protein NA56DRAFT_492722 [Hyaloscypha hepaticicola]